MRLPFYAITPDRHLIRSKIETGASPLHEEAVRQWCAYELIREYGVSVNDLEFEAQVQIGHKPKRIDILVRRNGKAWAVIECKAPAHKTAAKALTQAESYATSPSIRAEFVVYTNGDDWIVRRNVAGVWIPVLDLPKQHDLHSPSEDVARLLREMDRVKPLLANIDTPLRGTAARHYFEALQEFFHAANLFTHRVDKHLRFALDNLLRVISRRESKDGNYEIEKLNACVKSLETFRSKRNVGHEVYIMPDENTGQKLHALETGLHSMLESLAPFGSEDDYALKLGLAFATYAARQTPSMQYQETSAALHQAMREFLELGFARGLNAKLPPYIDNLSMADLRSAAGGSFNEPTSLKAWLNNR